MVTPIRSKKSTGEINKFVINFFIAVIFLFCRGEEGNPPFDSAEVSRDPQTTEGEAGGGVQEKDEKAFFWTGGAGLDSGGAVGGGQGNRKEKFAQFRYVFCNVIQYVGIVISYDS